MCVFIFTDKKADIFLKTDLTAMHFFFLPKKCMTGPCRLPILLRNRSKYGPTPKSQLCQGACKLKISADRGQQEHFLKLISKIGPIIFSCLFFKFCFINKKTNNFKILVRWHHEQTDNYRCYPGI